MLLAKEILGSLRRILDLDKCSFLDFLNDF